MEHRLLGQQRRRTSGRKPSPPFPPGRGIGDYDQLVLGQDISFAWRHLQVWAEFYQTRFELPVGGDADTFAYYIEAKYKLTPQLFAAVRWNQQFFDDIQAPIRTADFPGGMTCRAWIRPLIYRLTAHTQFKVQYNLQHEHDQDRGYGHTFAAQMTVRFRSRAPR